LRASAGTDIFAALMLIPLHYGNGPHIPDRPTEADASRLLSFMEVQVLYFEQGEAEQLTGVNSAIQAHIPGQLVSTHALVPVIGIGWICEHDTAIVYINQRPWAFAYAWIGGYEGWLNRESVRK
jgi:hypothetical protein